MSRELLKLLSDGLIHSGESLGDALQLSRAAVWKQVQRLIDYGVAIISVKGQGYQLINSLSLLDGAQIREHLNASAVSLLSGIDIAWSLPSTNAACLSLISKGVEVGHVCLAEHQSAGRGRRGRKWVSPLATNLYMSVIWRFAGGVEVLEGLSLAVGICVADTLREDIGLKGVQLKWPNDILASQKKLGGILIDITGDAAGPCYVVIGIGLNVEMPAVAAEEIDQPFTDIRSQMLSGEISRSELAAMILNRLLPMLENFESVGFGVCRPLWAQYDTFMNEQVVIQQGKDDYFVGKAVGVSETGGLLLEINGTIRTFKSGEASLRRG